MEQTSMIDLGRVKDSTIQNAIMLPAFESI